MGDYSFLLTIALMFVLIYFMIMRPESKRKKQAEEMRNSIKKGDRITTIGGMVGKVVQVNDSTVVFETSEDRVRVEIAKWGIQSTEAMEQAAAAQKSAGLFGRKSEDKLDSAKAEQSEKAQKEDKTDFDPEIK